jgi:formate dehydrogenase subunit gamma
LAEPPAAPPRIARFGRTERAAHWALAIAFGALTATGACLYFPTFALMLPRPQAKAIHLDAAIALGVALVALVAVGDRRALRRTARDLDGFTRDEVRFVTGAPSRTWHGEAAPPQGRFNGGQKLNAAVTLGLMVVLAVSGVLLWYGERDTRFRFAGSVHVHDVATMLVIVLVCGHVYLALLHPSTRAALDGMTRGDVDRAWARRHHARWVADVEAAEAREAQERAATTSAMPAGSRTSPSAP